MADRILSPIVLIVASLIPQAAHAHHPQVDLVSRICSKTQTENNTRYIETFVEIRKKMNRNGGRFSFMAMGDPPYKLHMLAECMNNLPEEECQMCLKQASNYLGSCLPYTGGFVLLDGCFMRTDNYSFFSESISSRFDATICSMSRNNTGRNFREAINVVFNHLLNPSPETLFAERNYTGNEVEIRGMSKCWSTLTTEDCLKCLKKAASTAMQCIPSTEARVINAGCFFRYTDEYSDFSENEEPVRG